jgi:hypothetical protein
MMNGRRWRRELPVPVDFGAGFVLVGGANADTQEEDRRREL